MSQQGPLLLVSRSGRPSFAAALDDAQMFPLVEAGFADAAQAVAQVQPSAVLADMADADAAQFAALAEPIAARKPYLPLLAINAEGALPENAFPFFAAGVTFARLPARLRAALRIRALHIAVLR